MKMKEWRIKLKEWWANLAVREKQAVIAGGLALGIFIIYQLIWSPLLEGLAGMRNHIHASQRLLMTMRTADMEINKINADRIGTKTTASPVVLLSLLQKKINQDGLDTQLIQLKQTSNNAIQVHFQKAGFDKIMRLLMAIVKERR